MQLFVSLLFLTSLISMPTMMKDGDAPRFGKVIAVSGKVTAVRPDGKKVDVHMGDEYLAGSTLITEEGGSVDLFFRRIGTLVELEENTSVTLNRLDMHMKDGKLVKETELSLDSGNILACVRVLIPDSKMIVKTPNGIFRAPGTGMGRYLMRADGSALVGRRSKLTLEVAGATGEPVKVMPGQAFDPKKKSAEDAHPTVFATFTPRMDKLQQTAQALTPPPAPEDLP